MPTHVTLHAETEPSSSSDEVEDRNVSNVLPNSEIDADDKSEAEETPTEEEEGGGVDEDEGGGADEDEGGGGADEDDEGGDDEEDSAGDDEEDSGADEEEAVPLSRGHKQSSPSQTQLVVAFWTQE
jgi:hypothetical protein